jgi:hypothetical protein
MMTLLKAKFLAIPLLVLLALSFTESAFANEELTITLTDTATSQSETLQVTNLGMITLGGTMVGNFDVTTAMGVASGSASAPMMDLNVAATLTRGSSSDTLTIDLLDTGFYTYAGGLTDSVGGTSDFGAGSVSFTVNGIPISVVFTGTGFHGDGTSSMNGSLDLFGSITENVGQVGSFNLMASPAPVPEPTTLVLLGVGLAGLGIGTLRKKRVA